MSPESKFDAMNQIEAEIAKLPPAQNFYKLTATPGILAKQAILQPGQWAMSEIHKTTHQWNVSAGVLDVYDEITGMTRVEAPDDGITLAGTRRFVHTHSDVVIWTTYHRCDLITEENWDKLTREDLEEIEKRLLENIIVPNENPYLKKRLND